MDRYFFLLIGVVGIVVGIFTIIRMLKLKVLYELHIKDEKIKLPALSPGLYSICIAGAGYVKSSKKIKIEISNIETNERVKNYKHSINYTFYYKKVIAIVFSYFKISTSGNFLIRFINLKDIYAKKSMLLSKQIFEDKMDVDLLKILIKEDFSIVYKILGLLLLAFGVFATIVGASERIFNFIILGSG